MDKFNQKWVSVLFREKEWAITINQTTFYSVDATQVNASWHRHEDKHKEQWRRDGCIKFAIVYLWYRIRYGYQDNPYEVEARKAEEG